MGDNPAENPIENVLGLLPPTGFVFHLQAKLFGKYKESKTKHQTFVATLRYSPEMMRIKVIWVVWFPKWVGEPDYVFGDNPCDNLS